MNESTQCPYESQNRFIHVEYLNPCFNLLLWHFGLNSPWAKCVFLCLQNFLCIRLSEWPHCLYGVVFGKGHSDIFDTKEGQIPMILVIVLPQRKNSDWHFTLRKHNSHYCTNLDYTEVPIEVCCCAVNKPYQSLYLRDFTSLGEETWGLGEHASSSLPAPNEQAMASLAAVNDHMSQQPIGRSDLPDGTRRVWKWKWEGGEDWGGYVVTPPPRPPSLCFLSLALSLSLPII